MKRLFSLLTMMFAFTLLVSAQNAETETKQEDAAYPVMEFETEVLDYGTIEQDSDPYR